LKGKLAEALPTAGSIAGPGSETADILNALVSLGYSEKEALAAIKGLAPGVRGRRRYSRRRSRRWGRA
jgi:Holliday junction DNA helicase RuvA